MSIVMRLNVTCRIHDDNTIAPIILFFIIYFKW